MTTDCTNWKAIAEMQAALVLAKFNYDICKDVLPVSDGCVCEESMVWWKSEIGPVHVKASDDWCNIKDYPNFYSVKEPRYAVTYLD